MGTPLPVDRLTVSLERSMEIGPGVISDSDFEARRKQVLGL
jgi:hypothetical protein